LDETKKKKWSAYAKAQNEKEKHKFYLNNPKIKPKTRTTVAKKKSCVNLPLRNLNSSSQSSFGPSSLMKTRVCPSCKYVNTLFTGSCKICFTRLNSSKGPPVPCKPSRISLLFDKNKDPTSVIFPRLRRFLYEHNLVEIYDRLEKQKVGLKLLVQIVREGGEDLHELIPSIGNRRRVVEVVNRQYPKINQLHLKTEDTYISREQTTQEEKSAETPISKEQTTKGLVTYKVVLESIVMQEHISKENLDMLRRLRVENKISLEEHKQILLELGVTEEDFKEKLGNTPNREIAKECVVCLDNPSTIAIQPCGHLALCQDCSPNFDPDFETSTISTCPRCRLKISKLLRIY